MLRQNFVMSRHTSLCHNKFTVQTLSRQIFVIDFTLSQQSHSANFVVTKFCFLVIDFTLSQQSHSANFVATKFCYVVTDFTLSQQSHSANFVETKFSYVAKDFTLSQQSHSANIVATKFYYVTTKIMTKTETLSRHNQVQLFCNKVLLCHDKDNYVATNLQHVATFTLEKSEKPKNCYVGPFSSPFHPRTINTRCLDF